MNTYPSVRMYTIFFIFWYILWIHPFFYLCISLPFSHAQYYCMVFLLLIIHYHNYYWILEYERSLKLTIKSGGNRVFSNTLPASDLVFRLGLLAAWVTGYRHTQEFK